MTSKQPQKARATTPAEQKPTPKLPESSTPASTLLEIPDRRSSKVKAMKKQHAAPKKTPDWATETPRGMTEYQLGMYSNCTGVQVIYLSRKDFVWLKNRLAKRCGFLPEAKA